MHITVRRKSQMCALYRISSFEKRFYVILVSIDVKFRADRYSKASSYGYSFTYISSMFWTVRSRNSDGFRPITKQMVII